MELNQMAFAGLTAAGSEAGDAAQWRVGYRSIPQAGVRWEDVEERL